MAHNGSAGLRRTLCFITDESNIESLLQTCVMAEVALGLLSMTAEPMAEIRLIELVSSGEAGPLFRPSTRYVQYKIQIIP
jgi:hypothetical protein